MRPEAIRDGIEDDEIPRAACVGLLSYASTDNRSRGGVEPTIPAGRNDSTERVGCRCRSAVFMTIPPVPNPVRRFST